MAQIPVVHASASNDASFKQFSEIRWVKIGSHSNVVKNDPMPNDSKLKLKLDFDIDIELEVLEFDAW